MTQTQRPFPSIARDVLAIALAVPFLAFAQAPATQPLPAAETHDAAKERAPSPPAKDAPVNAGKEAEAAPDAKDAPAPTGPIAPLAWLNGCWSGNVNKREFREFWHPLRGGMMVGVGHNALPDRTVSYEHLRLESNADGVFYYATPKGQRDIPFKLSETRRDGPDEIFLFTNGTNPFPTSIIYRRATGGWLYVEVAGKANGQDTKVIYPFRRVSCETGEFIRK
ncbi:MAG: DUF6265 family protein [Betaproteobacteria bacterium]